MIVAYPLENFHHSLIFYLVAINPCNYGGTVRGAEEALKTPGVEFLILAPPNNTANNLRFFVVEAQVADAD